jgi:hypothetical protein
MRSRVSVLRLVALATIAAVALALTGCATAAIEPGTGGLLFAPHEGCLKRNVLQPG